MYMYICTYIHINIYIHTYMFSHISIHTHIYIHTHTSPDCRAVIETHEQALAYNFKHVRDF